MPASSAHGKQACCRVPVFWLTAKWGHTATEPFPVVKSRLAGVVMLTCIMEIDEQRGKGKA